MELDANMRVKPNSVVIADTFENHLLNRPIRARYLKQLQMEDGLKSFKLNPGLMWELRWKTEMKDEDIGTCNKLDHWNTDKTEHWNTD